MSEEEGSSAERLMDVLISKMEVMDNTIQSLKAENALIKKHMANPEGLLKKMGFVSVRTPFAEGIPPDVFRDQDNLLKSDGGPSVEVPQSNAEFHSMNWDEIHALADSAKDHGQVGNVMVGE